ncbi:unnamed protein product [Prorocentrum cordatum]|uniref:Uncharacterized protein n=1 Tax=Prorocentrum cordatum TaxID=2364126 RepID=A0ABN9VE95_9DINO|nr:unnamed protein product [Polarella glacialis]
MLAGERPGEAAQGSGLNPPPTHTMPISQGQTAPTSEMQPAADRVDSWIRFQQACLPAQALPESPGRPHMVVLKVGKISAVEVPIEPSGNANQGKPATKEPLLASIAEKEADQALHVHVRCSLVHLPPSGAPSVYGSTFHGPRLRTSQVLAPAKGQDRKLEVTCQANPPQLFFFHTRSLGSSFRLLVEVVARTSPFILRDAHLPVGTTSAPCWQVASPQPRAPAKAVKQQVPKQPKMEEVEPGMALQVISDEKTLAKQGKDVKSQAIARTMAEWKTLAGKQVQVLEKNAGDKTVRCQIQGHTSPWLLPLSVLRTVVSPTTPSTASEEPDTEGMVPLGWALLRFDLASEVPQPIQGRDLLPGSLREHLTQQALGSPKASDASRLAELEFWLATTTGQKEPRHVGALDCELEVNSVPLAATNVAMTLVPENLPAAAGAPRLGGLRCLPAPPLGGMRLTADLHDEALLEDVRLTLPDRWRDEFLKQLPPPREGLEGSWRLLAPGLQALAGGHNGLRWLRLPGQRGQPPPPGCQPNGDEAGPAWTLPLHWPAQRTASQPGQPEDAERYVHRPQSRCRCCW